MGLSGWSRCNGLVRRKKLVHHFLTDQVQGFDHVAQGETVQVDDRGHQHPTIFGNLEGADGLVENLLAVLGEDLDPAAVPGSHDVAMVIPDTQGGRKGPVGQGHDDGQTHAGNDEENLVHQRQPLGAGRRVRARPDRRGAGADRQGGMFRFHRDKLSVQLAVGHQLRKMFDDMGLRGDGIGRDTIRLGQLHGLGGSDGDFHSYALVRHFSSSTILMHPVQHSRAQMPQPLQ